MTTIIVGLAADHDRDALCKLYHEFHEFHVHRVPGRLLSLGEPLETYKHSDLYKALAKIIEGVDSDIFVAQVEDQLIGLAEVYLRQDEPNPVLREDRLLHVTAHVGASVMTKPAL